MNDIRIPIALLVIFAIAFCGWFFYAHQTAMPAAVSTQQASTSTTAATNATAALQISQPSNAAPALSQDAVATALPGAWQSTDDPNYSVIITPDGKWTDSYKEASSTISESGTYTFFTSANPDPDFEGPLAQGVVYIKLVEGSDTYFYSVLEATSGNLQLSYLARGNTLSFVKER